MVQKDSVPVMVRKHPEVLEFRYADIAFCVVEGHTRVAAAAPRQRDYNTRVNLSWRSLIPEARS